MNYFIPDNKVQPMHGDFVRFVRVLIVAQVKNSVKMSACHRDAVFLCVAVRARATVSRTGAAS